MESRVYTSLYRITYTPAGGAPLVLLDVGDWCDGPLELTGDLATQVEQPILAGWAVHSSRGNAQMQLGFTHYAAAGSRAGAQIAGIDILFDMLANSQGELLLETAWDGAMSPQVSKRLQATLTSCTWKDLSGDIQADTLFALAVSYNFMVSPITEAA